MRLARIEDGRGLPFIITRRDGGTSRLRATKRLLQLRSDVEDIVVLVPVPDDLQADRQPSLR